MLRSLLDSAMSSEDLLLKSSKGSVHGRGRQLTCKSGMAGGAWTPRNLIDWCPAMHLLFATTPSHSEWLQEQWECCAHADTPSGMSSSLARAFLSVSIRQIHSSALTQQRRRIRETAMQRQSDRVMAALRQS